MYGMGISALLSAKPGPCGTLQGTWWRPICCPSVYCPHHTSPPLLPLTATAPCKQDWPARQQLVKRAVRGTAFRALFLFSTRKAQSERDYRTNAELPPYWSVSGFLKPLSVLAIYCIHFLHLSVLKDTSKSSKQATAQSWEVNKALGSLSGLCSGSWVLPNEEEVIWWAQSCLPEGSLHKH